MKTLIINLALLITIQVGLSGCIDFDFPDTFGYSGGFGGGYYSGGYNYDYPYYASFYIDSTSQSTDSTLTLWAHIQYDSILIIQDRKVEYWPIEDFGNPITKMMQAEPDTLDFRTLPDSTLSWTGKYEKIYHYNMQLDRIKKNSDYNINISSYYTEKGILKLSQLGLTVHTQ